MICAFIPPSKGNPAMSGPITPCYDHVPIQMKRVADKDDVDSVGEFAWADEDGKRYIMVALPRPRADVPDDYIMNFLPVVQGANVPGAGWGWDSNEDRPTLTPSIHCIGHWHGWIRAGMLVEA
jgi:hypothetical protein